ncbi:MAG: DNA internalization-related competence protein ComEC/Rec2 [Legionella sp.]|nr:DNA internalization-related competence protein ComEC/Rec2 [Legionella sp.]
MEILCFFAGVVFAYSKSLYPLLFIAIALFLRANRVIILWFLVAMVWAYVHQWWVADSGMPNTAVIQKALVRGWIISIPMSNSDKTQFQFSLNRLNDTPVKASALLSCYEHCPSFEVGQEWQLPVKLKLPENLGNPGSFDYKSNLRARHITWTGYIKRGKISLLKEPRSSILSVREHLSVSLQQSIPDANTLGIVQALTLGITNNIDKSLWDLFRRTGTTHLMVISGSHICLVAGIFYWLVRRLWSRSARLCLYRPAVQMAAVGGLSMAFFYSLLAGFAVPAQRAVVASIFLSLRHFQSRRYTAWQAWRFALLAVLIFEPHAVLLPGFYLSFLAVATLMAASQRLPYRGFKKVLCLQFACLLGLMPITLYWFSYGAINGLMANMIAIPLVGYIIVPLSLLVLFLGQVVTLPWLISFLGSIINVLLVYLSWIDKLAGVNFSFPLPNILALFALMIAIMIIIFLPLRVFLFASLILLIAALFPDTLRLKKGEARIDVLDVGQGLAVVINTASHTMVYDTGMKFYQGSDMGKMAIIPYLATLGIKKIDKVVISHPDMDHRGGLPSLEEKYPIGELLVDNIKFYHRGKNCHHYPAWSWDGISFRFIAIEQTFRDKNNSSCVLHISNQAGSVLLPGDIEKLAENYLVSAHKKELAADVLIVAHHGSKTSSTPAFIKYVSPQFAVISAGFDNRYHFPHAQTMSILATQGIKVFNTINCGMVTFTLPAHKKMTEPRCYHVLNR